jgi:mannose-6-phosphate isomerase
LDQLIQSDPPAWLGPDHARWGDRLPFLLKLLAVDRPLSLQVHPDAARARAGFAAEEASGWPLDAPDRSYRDPRAKPELALALTRFEALAGFRPVEASRAALEPLASPLARTLASSLAGPDPIRRTMTALLSGGVSASDVAGLVSAARACRDAGVGDVAAYEVVERLARQCPGDPGVAVALLMRHRVLAPGAAVFVPPGTLHCYLSGVAVEIQASSDNVLRAALTPKHVDVPALLAALDTGVGDPPEPRLIAAGTVRAFAPPVEEFRLAEVRLGSSVEISWPGPRIVIVLEGTAEIRTGGVAQSVSAGQAVFVTGQEGPLRFCGRGRAVLAAPAG